MPPRPPTWSPLGRRTTLAVAVVGAGLLPAAAHATAAPATAASAPAGPAVYRLDADRSFVHFEVLHFGTSTIRGRFGPVRGSVMLDRAARRGEVGVEIDVASVSTGFPLFDARLRREDLLAAEAWPTAWFVARQFEFGADGGITLLRGEFTMRGVSQGLTLTALRFACVPDPRSARERCGGDFEGEIDRSTVGASFGLPFVADRVRLLVQIDGLRD